MSSPGQMLGFQLQLLKKPGQAIAQLTINNLDYLWLHTNYQSNIGVLKILITMVIMVFDILIVNDSDSTSHTFQLEHGQHGILVYFITCILLYNLHPTL